MTDYRREYYLLQERTGRKVSSLQGQLIDEELDHKETYLSVKILAALLVVSVSINVLWLL